MAAAKRAARIPRVPAARFAADYYLLSNKLVFIFAGIDLIRANEAEIATEYLSTGISLSGYKDMYLLTILKLKER